MQNKLHRRFNAYFFRGKLKSAVEHLRDTIYFQL